MADPASANMLSAKFSIPYAVAVALVKGTTDVSAFTDAVREDAQVHRLAARRRGVQRRHHEGCAGVLIRQRRSSERSLRRHLDSRVPLGRPLFVLVVDVLVRTH